MVDDHRCEAVKHIITTSISGIARRVQKGGAPCPHFENGKYSLPFWPSTLPYSEHQNIEKYSISNISGLNSP